MSLKCWDFLRKIHIVILRDKSRNCVIRKTLNAELPLRIDIQLRWFDHVTRMPQRRLASSSGYTHQSVPEVDQGPGVVTAFSS